MALINDIKLATRIHLRKPGLTALAIVTLALGIGVNIAVFDLLNGTLLQKLSVPEPERLVSFYYAVGGNSSNSFSFPDYRDFSERRDLFESVACYSTNQVVWSAGESAERISAAVVSPTYFDVLGKSSVVLGRAIGPGDEAEAAVVSGAFWKRKLGGNSEIIGRPLQINGHTFTVVGVTSERFFGTRSSEKIDVWTTFEAHQIIMPWGMAGSTAAVNRSRFEGRGTEWVEVIARLCPGVTPEVANLAVERMSAVLMSEHRRNAGQWKPGVGSAGYGVSDPDTRRNTLLEMYVLLAVSGLVLLSACANVSSLMLASSSARWREVAVRLALGASRLRLFRQFLTENLLLGLAGGAAAVGFGSLFPIVMRALGMSGSWADRGLTLDLRMILFSVGVSVLAGVLFGFAPALHGVRQKFSIWLRQGRSGHARRSVLREGLVVVQIVVSLVLLIGAGLLTRSLDHWFALDPGLDRQNLLMLTFELAPAEAKGFYPELLQRARRVPGVVSATLTQSLPMDDRRTQWGGSRLENQTASLNGNVVGSDYFRTLGIPITTGRDFLDSDNEAGSLVVIINEAVARRFWPGRNPVGHQIEMGRQLRTIVGVAADSKHYDLKTLLMSKPLFAYIPASQETTSRMHLLVRTHGPAGSAAQALRREVRALNSRVVPVEIKTARQHVEQLFSRQRLAALLTGILSALALVLALSGVYGVVSSSVAERTQEIGIRIALGARTFGILRLVLTRLLVLTGIGIVVGVLLGLAAAETILNLVFGIKGHDPITFLMASLFIALVAVGAAIFPARRATHVDPITAIRYE